MPVSQLTPSAPWPELPRHTYYSALAGHDPAWLMATSQGLRHRPYVLVYHTEAGVVEGLLPLALVKSWLFGKFLVSLPYINTGGVWATTAAATQALLDAACNLADELDVRFLELRHETPVEHDRLNARRLDKVHMRLPLPNSVEALDQSFKSKLRSQIKKSGEHGLSIQWGNRDLLKPFYDVFAINMRDLGTPVFSRQLFAKILEAFGERAELCVVRQGASAVAAGLLVHYPGERTEVPSASSLRAFNSTGANMWMYRQMLGRAIERGSPMFDFGRSSEGSGTYKFKAQWGAEPCPAVWQYYVRRGNTDQMRPGNESNQKLIRQWQKLPVWLSRMLGPTIVRGIP
jgi:serine/alanine adding enzyme